MPLPDAAPDGLTAPGAGSLPMPEETWLPCGDLKRPLAASAIEYSPDGKRLAVGLSGRWIRIFRLPDMSVERAWQIDDRSIEPFVSIATMAFSPDGTLLAVWRVNAAKAAVIEIWPLTGSVPSAEFTRPLGDAPLLAFSPDGKNLLSATEDRTSMGSVQVYRLADRSVSGTFGRSSTAAWAEGGAAVVVHDDTTDEEAIFGYYRPTGQLIQEKRITGPGSGHVLSPDGKLVARRPRGLDEIEVHRLLDGQRLWGEPAGSRSSRPRFLGGRFLVDGFSPSVIVREVETGRPVAQALLQHSELSYSPWAVAPDGESLVVATQAGPLARFSTRTGAILEPAPDVTTDHSSEVWSMGVSTDGTLLASVSPVAGDVWLWRAGDRRFLRTITVEPIPVSAAFSSDNALVVTSSDYVAVHRVEDGKYLQSVPPPADRDAHAYNDTFVFAPDNASLAGGTPRGIELLRATDLKSVGLLPSRAGPSVVAFSPDGASIATSGYELWRTGDRTLAWIAPISLASYPRLNFSTFVLDTVAFSPDGKTILVSECRMGLKTQQCSPIRLLKAADGAVIRELDVRGRRPAFSRDGRWIVAADQLIETATGMVRPLGVTSVVSAFVADDLIVAGDAKGALKVLCPNRR